MKKLYKITKALILVYLLLSSIQCSKQLQSPFNEPEKTDDYFSIVILPDTQYYIAEKYGGKKSMFENQISWVINHLKDQRIAYVTHLGDVTETNAESEWQSAKEIMQPLYDQDIPFGIAIGNHDGTPYNKSSKGNSNTMSTKYFGKDYFASKSWYGGSITNNNNNDNHFDLISTDSMKLILIYNDYNQPSTEFYDSSYESKVIKWDDSLLSHYSDRKAIMVSHSILKTPTLQKNIKINNKNYSFTSSEFSGEGQLIYNMAKNHNNVFLMLCGHVAGEAIRIDQNENSTIKTILSDYQFETNGGNGKMRLVRINLTKNTLSVITFIPNPDGTYYKFVDINSQYQIPLFN